MATQATCSRVRATDKNFEKVVTQWFEEIEDEDDNEFINNCNEGDASDIDFEASDLESEHDSETEESCGEEDEIVENELEVITDGNNASCYYSKNNFKWRIEPENIRTKTKKHNIVTQLPGIRGSYRAIDANPEDLWNLLVDDTILCEVLRWTNVKIERERNKYANKTRSELRNLDMIELKAFVGLLLFSAVFKSNHEDINTLFATDGTGRDIFRAVMSKNRFAFLLTSLRFDNPDTRSERKDTDPTAPISFIFEQFVNNCQKIYSVGSNTTVDEMLVSFRGRCSFRMYIPNKPAKYGLKIMALTDAKTHYFLNGYIYAGKGSDGQTLSLEEQNLPKPTQAVVRLAKPIYNTNRNITADNWFTSVDLVYRLLKEYGLTYIGTMKKNKKEIPTQFQPNKNRQTGSSLYGFTPEMTLISYVPKKSKAVILLSSMHNTKSTDPETNKPEIITEYNNTKSGVDSLDEKCVTYCTGRRTRRWSMAIFFRILDISNVNAFVLYSSHKNTLPMARVDFIKKLAAQLVNPHLKRRSENPYIKHEIHLLIRRILNIKEQPAKENMPERKMQKRKTCSLCSYKKQRKTAYYCIKCNKPIWVPV